MSARRGHIRYTAIAVTLIVILIAVAAASILLRFSSVAASLELDRHIMMYLEEKDRTETFPICLHSVSGPVMTERTIKCPILSDRLHLAMEALLLDETAEDLADGLVSYIPDKTKLIGISVKNGYAFADFSKELSDAPEEAFEEIALTIKANTDAKHIRIMIEGMLLDSECEALD